MALMAQQTRAAVLAAVAQEATVVQAVQVL
jgi:hypothetical protein